MFIDFLHFSTRSWILECHQTGFLLKILGSKWPTQKVDTGRQWLAFPQNHPVKNVGNPSAANIDPIFPSNGMLQYRKCQATVSPKIYNPNGLRLSMANIPKTANVSWALGTPMPHLHAVRTCTTGAQVEHNRRPQKRQWCRRQKVLKVSQRRFFGWMGWGISNRFLDKKCWDLNYTKSQGSETSVFPDLRGTKLG